MLRNVTLATGAALLLLGSVASADVPSQPLIQRSGESGNQVNQGGSEAERALRFRKLIEQATQDFNVGRYEPAIEGYSAAYQLRRRAPILFNIAQVHRKAGHSQEALKFYEDFLREDPQSELAPEVRNYVDALRASSQSTESSTERPTTPNHSDNFLGTEEQRQSLFRKHSEAAVASFKAGDYETTAAEYWAAYSLKPLNIILFNIAQAYRRASRWPEALALFQRYLRQEPGSALAGEVEGYITEAKARLSAKQSNADRQSAERLAKANALLAERLVEIREIDRKIAAQSLPLPAKPIYRRAWFWGLLGGSVVSIGLGVGLGVGLSRRIVPSTDLGLRVLDY